MGRGLTVETFSRFKYLFIVLTLSSVAYLFLQTSHFQNVKKQIKYIDNEIDNDTFTKSQQIYPVNSNIPDVYLSEDPPSKAFNSTCAIYPQLEQLHFSNTHWQVSKSEELTLHIFGAYLDTRPPNEKGQTVRITALIYPKLPRSTNSTNGMYCQLWYDEIDTPVIVNVVGAYWLWRKFWKQHNEKSPYILNCDVPKMYHDKVPSSVSVVHGLCETATNNLKIIYNKVEHKKDFAICVKALDILTDEHINRLVEWAEMLFILGASKIYFGNFDCHPKVRAVLNYYEQRGKIEVTPITIPAEAPNAPMFRHKLLQQNIGLKRHFEVIEYNDCFYKHMYEYEYLAMLDVDEILMPLQHNSWVELFSNISGKTEADDTLCFGHTYFLDELEKPGRFYDAIPKNLHMLHHVHRMPRRPGFDFWTKCFHKTTKVLTVHNHYPLKSFDIEPSPYYMIGNETAQLQHYRSGCVYELQSWCVGVSKEDIIVDNNIWRFKDELTANVDRVLKNIRF